MKKQWALLALAIILLGASGGFAQAPAPSTGGNSYESIPSGEGDVPEVPATPAEAAPAQPNADAVAEPVGEAPAPEAGAPTPKQLPDVYVVQPGDTLWDICGKFFDNPWYWPKLWALNQYIENPHLIYPGNKLSFFAGSETAPPKLDIVPPSDTAAAKEAPATGEAKEDPLEAVAPRVEPTVIQGEAADAGRPLTVKLKSLSFVSKKQLDEAGKISHSGEPRMHLTAGDPIYLKFKNPKKISVGDKFFVIKKARKVDDPESIFGNLGHLVYRKAVLRVTAIHKDTIEAVVVDNADSIERGDVVIPWYSPIKTVTIHRTDKKIDAKVVESEAERMLVGTNDFVYINRGTKHGIDDGLELLVLRRGDAVVPGDDDDLPYTVLGRLIVVETFERTATAYVIDSKDDINIGAYVSTTLE